MNDRDKFTLVRKILFRDWDPADVNENRHLADEYDDYVHGAIDLLVEGCSTDQLTDYLSNIEKKCLESDFYRDGAQVAARNLIEAWNSKFGND
ncbi:MAG: hypothetical protein ACLPSF_02215 [Methylocella sp.]